MEAEVTQSLSRLDPTQSPLFKPGSAVIYPLHGRCVVMAIEEKSIGGTSVPFYKLERSRSNLSRATRPEPAIWLPVSHARERGLRSPMDSSLSQEVFAVLTSREYYFSTRDSWSAVQPLLEASIRAEGAIGLAKVMSYLHVLKKKQIVPASEVAKFDETVSRLLLRELSDLLGEPIRSLEERIQKGFKQKMQPDS